MDKFKYIILASILILQVLIPPVAYGEESTKSATDKSADSTDSKKSTEEKPEDEESISDSEESPKIPSEKKSEVKDTIDIGSDQTTKPESKSKKETTDKADTTKVEVKPTAKELRKQAVKHYNQGVELHKKGHFNKAILEYKEAINANPKLEQAYSNLGLIYTAQKSWNKAMEAFEKALEIKPDRATSLNGLGSVLLALKKPEQAMEKWEKAISINPNFESAYFNMGVIYENEDNYIKALEVYNKALAVNPRMADSYFRMGTLMNKKEHPAQALVLLNKAISLEPAGDFVREARKQIASITKDLKKEETEIKEEKDLPKEVDKKIVSDNGATSKKAKVKEKEGKGIKLRSLFKRNKKSETADMDMFIQPPKEQEDLKAKPKS